MSTTTDENRFGDYMAALRKGLSLNLAEASVGLGVSTQDILNWESGRALPPSTLIYKIAEIYRVPIIEFREILDLENERRALS